MSSFDDEQIIDGSTGKKQKRYPPMYDLVPKPLAQGQALGSKTEMIRIERAMPKLKNLVTTETAQQNISRGTVKCYNRIVALDIAEITVTENRNLISPDDIINRMNQIKAKEEYMRKADLAKKAKKEAQRKLEAERTTTSDEIIQSVRYSTKILSNSALPYGKNAESIMTRASTNELEKTVNRLLRSSNSKVADRNFAINLLREEIEKRKTETSKGVFQRITEAVRGC